MVVDVAHQLDGTAGPALVLSNSLGTTAALWDPQVPALAARHRVVRYDHRGHGRSPVPDGPYSIDDLGCDALRLLDRLELATASFCGTSLGGMVGMWVAAHAPERIDRLVLLCTAAHLTSADAWFERAALVRERGMEAVADAVVGRWFTAEFAATNAAIADAFRAGLVATPPAGYAGCCAAIGGMDLRADLARVTAPTLVVAGGADPATTVHDAEVIASGIPGAQLVVIDGAAHLAAVEHPTRVSELILEHLS